MSTDRHASPAAGYPKRNTPGPLTPRLLPDYAAAPTAAERAACRSYWQGQQTTLDLADDPTAWRCAACAGNHQTGDCPNGIALTLTGEP